ncbi:uncharacterized protein LOC142142629 [Mixophyes fleayi]|uniref:uncharacterized protein LOC142142629 n=1 Tax=Mixophyes fleayi TaxID=3061075 RepID=UPI003F4DF2BD
MILAEKMKLSFRLLFLAAVLATEVCTQQTPTSDFIVSSCRRSLIQFDLPAQYVLKKYVRFSAIDTYGTVYMITNALASKCGYTISQDDWGNINFRSSLFSCYADLQNDPNFTVTVKIEISPSPDMNSAESYTKVVSCPYVWSPREITCEINYMEVSVRRKIPVIAEGIFKDEPEDWSYAIPQAISGLMSIWQVVFHRSQTQKTTMMVDAALNIGYGINTTESRTLVRAPYNTSEAVQQRVDGVEFSTVRATLFYKQRWFIFLVDNAVACPVDDVKHTNGWITWTVPKTISPLLVGAKITQFSSVQFGIDLLNLTDGEIQSRKYEIADSSKATVVRIPVGAEGGYYKSHVVDQEYGIIYHIRPFLEDLWVDDGWGVTKYTIIKDITTPFDHRPPVLTNDTIPLTSIFNVTIGTFLPDVKLVNLTIGSVTFTVQEAVDIGYISPKIYPNGSIAFVLKVPFTDPRVSVESFPDGTLFTLNVTFGFNIIPYDETFTTPATTVCYVPQPTVGPCGQQGSSLTATIGNLMPDWTLYIKSTQVTSNNGLLLTSNRTHSTFKVPAASDLVMDGVDSKGLVVTVPLTIKDQSGATLYELHVSCESVEVPVVCLPNGTIQVTVKKQGLIPDMDLSLLTLRDSQCGPAEYSSNMAHFTFAANSCKTTRKFEQDMMIYENEISYYSVSSRNLLYVMNVSCSYTINGTLLINYNYKDNPTPSAQSAIASLDLTLRLSKDRTYTDFYGDVDYPVVKYLRDSLYFEVELLFSSDPRLELFLDRCWATTTPEMSSLPTWPIIDNSCEHSEPYQTSFHRVTADSRVQFPSHFKRFEVKAFTFIADNVPYMGAIYFHCDVIICDSSNLSNDPACTGIGSCIPAKQRLGRSVKSNTDEHRSLSSEAVVFLAHKVEPDTKHF